MNNSEDKFVFLPHLWRLPSPYSATYRQGISTWCFWHRWQDNSLVWDCPMNVSDMTQLNDSQKCPQGECGCPQLRTLLLGMGT